MSRGIFESALREATITETVTIDRGHLRVTDRKQEPINRSSLCKRVTMLLSGLAFLLVELSPRKVRETTTGNSCRTSHSGAHTLDANHLQQLRSFR